MSDNRTISINIKAVVDNAVNGLKQATTEVQKFGTSADTALKSTKTARTSSTKPSKRIPA